MGHRDLKCDLFVSYFFTQPVNFLLLTFPVRFDRFSLCEVIELALIRPVLKLYSSDIFLPLAVVTYVHGDQLFMETLDTVSLFIFSNRFFFSF